MRSRSIIDKTTNCFLEKSKKNNNKFNLADLKHQLYLPCPINKISLAEQMLDVSNIRIQH
jgi:hypothetical protein